MTALRTLAAALLWVDAGTTTFVESAVAIPSHDWARPSGLPRWTRSHVVAHVAANAEALSNLARWAVTGKPAPMYPSREARAEGIAMGERLSPLELLTWLRRSAEQLDSAISAIDSKQWGHEVVTALGRVVPASEIPWMRAREVWVHAVDLSNRTSFADLPEDFLLALREDIAITRGGMPAVTGPLAEVVAYLAGRPARGVGSTGSEPAPELEPWL